MQAPACKLIPGPHGSGSDSDCFNVQDVCSCCLLGKLQFLLKLNGAHDFGGHGVADGILLAEAFGAVGTDHVVIVVVLAGVDQQGVALDAELSAILCA